jgi:hypothetical protein
MVAPLMRARPLWRFPRESERKDSDSTGILEIEPTRRSDVIDAVKE